MEDDELIYKKLSDELTADEAQQFEHRLMVDPAFAEEYDFQRSALTALVQSEQTVMKEKLQRVYREVQHRRQRRRWAVAAVVALLLVGGGILGYQRFGTAPLYEQYYTLYQPYPEVRGASVADRWTDALQRYQRGNFDQAQAAFEALPRSDRRDLYLAHCYWQTGDVATAQRYFATVRRSDNDLLRQAAEWYLALGLLRQDKLSEARQLLQEIVAEEALYYKEARELLGKLE